MPKTFGIYIKVIRANENTSGASPSSLLDYSRQRTATTNGEKWIKSLSSSHWRWFLSPVTLQVTIHAHNFIELNGVLRIIRFQCRHQMKCAQSTECICTSFLLIANEVFIYYSVPFSAILIAFGRCEWHHYKLQYFWCLVTEAEQCGISLLSYRHSPSNDGSTTRSTHISRHSLLRRSSSGGCKHAALAYTKPIIFSVGMR